MNIDKTLLNEDGSVPFITLRNCIKKHKGEVQNRFNKLYSYYKGEHNILSRTFMNPNIPNNKLVCNHAEYITDMAVGYVFGIPVSYNGDNVEYINELFTEIEEDSHNSELALDISIFGKGYELIYMNQDETPLPQLATLSPLNSFVVFDNTVIQKPLFGVHYYVNYDIEGKEKDYTVEVYLNNRKDVYKFKKLEDDTPTETLEAEPYYFDSIPLIEYKNNKELQGDFEGVISLIDAYNKLQSDRINQNEQLTDSFLVIVGQSLGDTKDEVSETVKYLMENKIIELDQDGDAKWLTKELNETEIEVLKKAIKDDIHEFSKVPCMTDDSFVGNSSGVAMKYKLLGFEQLGKTKERYFKKGLKQRLKIISNIEGVRANNIDIATIDISMERSLPVDDELLARVAQSTEGLLSHETRIKKYDPEMDATEEIKKIDEEKQKSLEQQQAVFESQFPSDKVNTNEEEK